jgi:alkylation response protein AidB-like acyl-CoA dehydrogenase
MASQIRLAQVIEDVIELARTTTGPDGRRPAIEDDGIARKLGRARAEVAALRAMTLAGISRARHSDVPGPEGSMVKLYYSEVNQRISFLAHAIQESAGIEAEEGDWSHAYLGSFSMTIGGGTSEIQRNIIGERVLGLPKDRRPTAAGGS